MADPALQLLIQKAITAAKAIQQAEVSAASLGHGPTMEQREQARQLLLQVIEQDQSNIPAWLWLSTVVPDPEEKQLCLENVLVLDPKNQAAQNGLTYLAQQGLLATPAPAAPSPPPSANTAKEDPCPFCGQPVAAFDTVCRHCQAPLIISCPACEQRVDVEERYCVCGQFLGEVQTQVEYFAQLAAAYERHKRPEKVLATWRTVAQLQPDYPHVLLHIGEAEATSGRTDAAISTLHQAMREPADEHPAALALGKILQKLQRWDEAERLFRRVVSAAPRNPAGHFSLAWFLMERGQPKEALPHIKTTLKLDPQHGLAWLRMAQLQEYFQNRKQAAHAYEQASRFLPKNSLDKVRSQRKLDHFKPALPVKIAANWGELLRQVTGPIVICVLAALLDAGLRPWWIPLNGWVAILLSLLGSFLWVSGSSLPLNPLLVLLGGKKAFASEDVQFTAATLGLILWLLALGIILWPIGQFFPEVPAL